jgi:hypothetical protein
VEDPQDERKEHIMRSALVNLAILAVSLIIGVSLAICLLGVFYMFNMGLPGWVFGIVTVVVTGFFFWTFHSLKS